MEPTRVYCRDCGFVVFEGEWNQAAADSAAEHPECPNCGSTGREYAMAFTVTTKASASYKAGVAGPEPHSAKHPHRRSLEGGRFVRGDGRGHVNREIDINREHDPPYKWHRVTGDQTGEIEKNLLERFDTGESWDFLDPSMEPPDWFPFDPRS